MMSSSSSTLAADTAPAEPATTTTTTTTASAPSLKSHFASLAPPPLIAHLTDSTGHPILSTATTTRESHYLQGLSHAYLAAHDTASRMGLGQPSRIAAETARGTVIMQCGADVDPGIPGEMLVAGIVAPVDRTAEARVASWGAHEVAVRVGRVIGEGRRARGV